MAAKICPRCGYYNSSARKTCSLCDALLDAGAENVPVKYSFYDVNAKNKRNSVILLIALSAILVALGYFIGEYFGFSWYGAAIAFAIAVLTGLNAYYNGKSIVMAISGAKKVTRDSEPVLVNIVEEISIAAGMPIPETYVIESGAMNAFATGRDPQHAAIAVTRGLLNVLNREELAGVIAHEMSHISHLDIRFAMLVGILVGTIVLISDFALRYMFWGGKGRKRSNSKNSGNAGLIILAVVIVLAIISPILAKIIQMSISRKRELMADAQAAEYTRNPEGLANALEKIGTSKVKLETATRATQHMYIVNPLKSFSEKSKSLFSTHPPIEARIKILRSM